MINDAENLGADAIITKIYYINVDARCMEMLAYEQLLLQND